MRIPSYLQMISRRLCRGIDVPDDLSPVMDIDPAEVRDEAETELADGDVEAIWQATEALFRTGMHPMIGLCLRRRGKIVLNRTLGYASGVQGDDSPPVVADLNTPVCLYSAAKSVTAMLIHKLAEEGLIDLLAPVSYYIPAFAAKGKSNITIYHLLAHRAGVPGVPADVPREHLFNHEEALQWICESESLHVEGRVSAYHAVTGGFVLAELVRVLKGMDIAQYLDEVVRRPMGMRYFTYGLPEEQRPLAARNYVSGPRNPLADYYLKRVLGVGLDEAVEISNSDAFMSTPIPSANIYATAEEASRFYQMLINHGQWNGVGVMDPLTVYRATREVDGARFDKSLLVPMRYSPGMMLGGDPVGVYGARTHFAFGHIGFANILCWGDPERDIAVGLLTSGKPVLSNHVLAVLRLINAISSRCTPCIDIMRDEPHFYRQVLP